MTDLFVMFQDPFVLLMLLMMGALLIFFFRSNKKRKVAMQELEAGLKPGADIMLQSGIYGRVVSIDNEAVKAVIEFAPGVNVTVHRNAIAQVVKPSEATSAVAESNDATPAKPAAKSAKPAAKPKKS